MSVVGKAKQHYYEDQDYLFKNKMTSTMKEPGSNWKSLQGSFVKEPIVSPTGQLISLRPYMECL